MDKKHELICALKQLAQELGQTPTRDQFKKMTAYGTKYETAFGTWNKMIEAAGLVPNLVRDKRINNEIFNVKIESYLESYKPSEVIQHQEYPHIASISDIHWPFHSQRVIDAFLKYVGNNKPDFVFLNGDAWDMYSHSKFPRSHNIFTPREEETTAREQNIKFWESIILASPNSICTQMMGNHDIRPMKRVLEVYPEAEDWIKERLTKLFTFQGVNIIFDPREEVILGDICIFHGYRSGLGQHRDYTLLNCINGHTHVGGTVFRRIRGQTLWELNSGLAGDPEAKGLTYTPQKITHWTPGFGVVDKNGPRFIPV